MNKVGIKKIGFVEQNEVDDLWQQEQIDPNQPADRAVPPEASILGFRGFRSIDQDNSSLSQQLDSNESGPVYDIDLSFVVRTEDDIALAKKYERRPVVMYVWTVDGVRRKIGSKQYPAMMLTDGSYDGRATHEVRVSVAFQALKGIL